MSHNIFCICCFKRQNSLQGPVEVEMSLDRSFLADIYIGRKKSVPRMVSRVISHVTSHECFCDVMCDLLSLIKQCGNHNDFNILNYKTESCVV